MRDDTDHTRAYDPIESGHLSPELEADFIEAMAPGAPISDALQAHLRHHPRDAQALDLYRDLGGDLAEDTQALDPGGHFFDALQADILGQLDAPKAAPLPGGFATRPAQRLGLIARLQALLGARPTLAWGALMLALILGLILWPRGEEAPEPDKAPEIAAIEAPIPTSLSEEELSDLRQLASRMDLDLEEWEADEDTPLGDLQGLSDEEFKEVEEALVEL